MNMKFNVIFARLIELTKNFDVSNPEHTTVITYIIIICVGTYSLNFIGIILSFLFGIAYPIVKSYTAKKSKNENEVESVLMYWIFFGCYLIIENLFSVILMAFPFYHIAKTLLFIWASYSNGAKLIYSKYICPKMEEYDIGSINDFIKIFSVKLDEAISEYNNLKKEE